MGTRGLVSAMTLAALSFSNVAGSQPDGTVVVGGSAVVVVDGSDQVSVDRGEGQWSVTSVLRCDAASASTGAVDERVEAPADAPAIASTLTRLLCAVGTRPADFVRPALPRIAPWLSLMHF